MLGTIVVQPSPDSKCGFSIAEDNVQKGNYSSDLSLRLLFLCVHALDLI
jgi:hypothetical protein